MVCGVETPFPGIEKNLGVAGGTACIARTRIPVWVLVEAQTQGSTDADLLENYPTLSLENLAQAWSYSRAHPKEIERAIRENREA